MESGSLVGRQIGGYKVLALVGAGGMGEVYRARDTRLDRDVALKVLQQDRADDPVQHARFLREARAASALNHPNILAVFDVGVDDGIPFIVSEFIDGASLRQSIERAPLPIQELLNLAAQIADGLTAAHEAEIVHRDLKPENVMVTRDGRVKILDFGLAKAPSGTTAAGGPAQLVTQTEVGLIQGTVPYMSPEQARGVSADFRADQFALGLIVYEMATGKQAFRRETPVQTLSAIITDKAPAIAELNPRAPASLRWLIERCLAKDPAQRYTSTRDLAQDLGTLRDHLPELSSGRVLRRRGWIWLSTAGIGLLAAFGLGYMWSHRSPPAPPYRFTIPAPDRATFSQSSAFMAVAPNGKSIAFVASSPQGSNMLWVRALDDVNARLLPGTDGAGQPFWSPDSKFLAFSTIAGNRTSKRIDVSTGTMLPLAEAIGSGAWGRDDTIIVPSDRRGGALYRVSLADGSVTPVTTLDASRGEVAHLWPSFLPDNRHFLFLAVSEKPEHDSVLCVGSLDSPGHTPLFHTDSHAVYVPPGYLLYMLGSTLFAQPFDAQDFRATGDPVIIATAVERTVGPKSRRGAFSVSQSGGVLAYRQVADTQLIWFDHEGNQLDPITSPSPYGNPTLSPDERHVAVNRLDPATGAADIWIIDDRGREVPSRFTIDPSEDAVPLWTPDGRSIVYRSSRHAPLPAPVGPAFYTKSFFSSAPDHLLLSAVGPFGIPLGWTPDGALLYEMSSGITGMDLWSLPATADPKPVQFLHTEANERQGQLSPDGQWIAYVSDESKPNEVYVRRFPSGEAKKRVSTGGGIEPKWRGDGAELFYLATDDAALMSVTMKLGSTVEAGKPHRLFETHLSTLSNQGYTRNQYLVTRDGQRFLLNRPATTTSTPITVALNWSAALKR